MSIKADYHLHSHHSGDCSAAMEEMIVSGIAAGLETMCFTEHNDFDYRPHGKDTETDHTFELNADSYLYELLGLRSKYEGQIELLFGLECGMQPHLAKENVRFIKEHDYDFILASLHVCGGKDPYFPEFFESKSEEEALREYLEETFQNIRVFGNFDCLAHLDYIIRYCRQMDRQYEYAKYKDILDKILNFLIDREKALELNTAGLRKGMSEMNPCREVIARYHELGGELITIGSDAHKPEDVASHFDKAEELLKDCGFSYYTVYNGRIAMMKKL